ncbi:MAG: hypothetical protein ACOY71_00005 [Gemmatimonadota bacterium]
MTDPATLSNGGTADPSRPDDQPPLPGLQDTHTPVSRSVADGNLLEPMDLHEFLVGLGLVFRLATKRKKAPAPPAGGTATAGEAAKADRVDALRAERSRKVLIYSLAVISLVAGAFALWPSGDGSKDAAALPAEVQGRWTTTNPKYKDRAFALSASALTLQMGPRLTDAVSHPILKVTFEPHPDGTVYHVQYETVKGQEPITMSFRYTGGASPVIRLINQPNVEWVKARPRPGATKG